MRVCSVDECGRTVDALGLCSVHYRRLRRSGDPRGGKRGRLQDHQRRLEHLGLLPEIAYLTARIQRVDGCWQWVGANNGQGYGHIDSASGSRYVHRAMYSKCVDDIPAGLHIDHLCRNPSCCNPAHLEPVTQSENIRRSPLVGRKSACKYGHPFSDENTYVSPTGARRCRTCAARRSQERRNLRRSE